MSTVVATPTRVIRMRTPEYSTGSRRPPDGQHFENEYFQYLKPESFTVLPPENNASAAAVSGAPGVGVVGIPEVSSPPRAPEPYKLTPRKRHKNQAFSIIAEPGLSAPNSRAGSPTGRVSPFRGRGFNPTSSRKTSPAHSPLPGELLDDDAILRHSRELQLQLKKSSIGRSQIPILKTSKSRDRRSSAEDILSPDTSPPEGFSPTRSNLQANARYSRSMINIAPRNLAKKPPPSPRRASNLKSSFLRLSPIMGSSPEAGSDQMSSPSRIPRSRSQPPSRILSPTESRNSSRGPSRPPSRGPSRPSSRSTSREPSPGRSPSKIPMKNSAYKNIPAKVDTFSRVAALSKPKVPQKPKVYSTRTSNLDRSRPSSIRKNVNKSQIGSNKSPRRETDDTETTDTDRETVRSNTRSSNSSYSKDTSRRNSISKPSTSGYSKQQSRSKYDGENPSTSRGYGNSNKNTTDSYDRSSTTSTVADGGRNSGNYSSKTSDKRNDNRSDNNGKGNKTNSQTFRRDETGAKGSRSRRHDTTTATSTTEDLSKSDDETTEDARDDDILSVTIDEIIGGSQTTKIVSATTETVVKPLNIEAKLIKQSEANQSEYSGNSSSNQKGNYNSTSNQKYSTNTSSNSSANQKGTTNSSTNGSSNQKGITNTSSNGSSNQRGTTNTSSNGSSNQRGTTNTNSNGSSNQKGNTNTSSNVSSNQRGNSNTTSNSSNQKATSDSNTHGNINKSSGNTTSSNNNPSSNLTTPANGSVVNTPTSNQNNLSVSDQHQISSSTPTTPHPSESVNNNLKHVSNSLTPSVNSLEMNVKNNLNNLTPPDSDKVSSKSLMDSSSLTNSAKMKQSRTVIVDEIKPIKITVREKSGDIEVQSGNYALPRSATNGIAERPLLPPNNHAQNANEAPPSGEAPPKPGACSKIFSCCKKSKPEATSTTADGSTVTGVHSLGSVAPNVGAAETEKPPKCWEKICCKTKGGKVGDSNKFSCFPKLKKGKDNENWAERRDSILSEPPKKQSFSMTLRKIFCTPCAKCKKKPDESVSRRTSMMSKKKSLSSTMQPPPEDTGPKLEASLVEHASHMRGAIPVLPVPLAWICLICNVFVPGFGTILSGLFCLCIGKPRFSPRDSAKARVGAFFIDVIVGISQAFTVLFCLVGWGWSIWWGVIMLKIARKHRKIERLEKVAIEEPMVPSVNVNHSRDVERGS